MDYYGEFACWYQRLAIFKVRYQYWDRMGSWGSKKATKKKVICQEYASIDAKCV